jgi:hypothetical protein
MRRYEVSRRGGVMGRRRERRRQDDRTADRIAMALEMIRRSDERWHGLAKFLANTGMDRDAELLGPAPTVVLRRAI